VRHLRSRFTFAAIASLLVGLFPGAPVAAGDIHSHIECGVSRNLCAEVDDLESFSAYVGHDEPSLLFYSNHPGSGNRMQYVLTLPTDPVAPTGVPSTGVPHASASTVTSPKPSSSRVGRTKTSAAW